MLTQRATSIPVAPSIPAACPKCGTQVPPPADEAHRRILDLETQVRVLNSKASAAVDRLADYEDEVHALRAQCARLQQSQPARQSTPVAQISERTESPSQIATQNGLHVSPPRTSSRLASLSSFFGKKEQNALSTPPIGPQPQLSPTPVSQSNQQSTTVSNVISPLPPQSAGTTTTDLETPPPLPARPDQNVTVQTLQSSLENERSRRVQAETSLNQTQTELEELTAQLFGQANEMVATERKARMKLEERVKLLENRDGEKRQRLERLERALQRIERVRGLVERRNTVNGVVDRKERIRLEVAGISEGDNEDEIYEGKDEEGMADPGRHNTNSSSINVSVDRHEIKRKAVGTGNSSSDRDLDRHKNERKGTV